VAASVGRRPRVIPRRTRHANVWLADDEYALVAAAARRDGMTVGGYAAATAVAVAAGQQTPVPADSAARWRALGQARVEAARLRDGLQRVADALQAGRAAEPAELRVVLSTAEATVDRLDEATIALHPLRPARRR
jgi:hypothetical protein